LYNSNLDISDNNNNYAWTNHIFNDFGDQAQKLVGVYNEIRQSDFMTKMREKYIENGPLKPGLTYSQVAEEMMSLEIKNELSDQEITDWDKCCHFFSYILKGITALFTLGTYVYQSTKDEKEENNRRFKAQEDDNKQVTQGNNITVEELKTWSQFAKEYKEKTKVEGPAME